MFQYVQERLERNSEFISKVVKCDETWVYRYDSETK
jgi:hypothetical protein